MADKEYRLNKVAAELNISTANLVGHLQKKGFQVENKPTAKISDEMYQVLLAEFRQDKAIREESRQIQKQKNEDKPVPPPSLKTLNRPLPRKEEVEEKVEPVVVPPPVEVVFVPEPEPVPVVPVVETPVVPVEEAPRKDDLPGLVVLGRIENLEARPKKKEKEKEKPAAEVKRPVVESKETPVKEDPKAEEVPIAQIPEVKEPEVKKPEVKVPVAEERPAEVVPVTDVPAVEVAEPKVEAPLPPGVEENAVEKVETRFEKISGLNIKGKIVLPVEQPRKSAADGEKGKRPRKKIGAEKVRIDKVKENPAGGSNPAAPGNRETKTVSQEQVRKNIGSTMRGIQSGGKGRGQKDKHKKDKRDRIRTGMESEDARRRQESRIIKVTEFISANELASLMNVSVNQVITACFSLGLMVSINQRLDAEIIQLLAGEFGFEVEFVDADSQIDVEEEVDREEDLRPRPPIVTVMGHVDHGKTSLLDHIRSTNVIAGEAGGITQHIGAYEVTLPDGRKITFLDTPGHEAFTAMRARGAKVTDIAIIVVAADDSVMPQTREAISHAQAAGVPMVFAINKIDKDGANSERIREQLAQLNILVEDWGGKFQAQEISAKKGINMDKLLEKVLLEAEMLELKANPDRLAKGTVVEATLEKGRGVVCSLLVQTGTLSVGDNVVAGPYYGRVKALFNERGQRVDSAPPSTPVKMLGFSETPTAGDQFIVLREEADAKDLANKRFQLVREQGMRTRKHITLDEIGRRLSIGNFKELNLIVKGDVDGSVEALSDSFLKLSTEEIKVNVIHKGVGQITESDVLLASASDAIIIGFNVRPGLTARKLAEHEEIDIRNYSIIYKAIEEVKMAMEGMLSPETVEKVIGNVEVRDVFRISKVGAVAGAYVMDGKVERNAKVRVLRDGVVLHEGDLSSLKRFKDDVKEVTKGYECGLQVAGFNDIEVGDYLEVYKLELVKRKLD
ncbi:MAG: translation initiation factor IF-2 [Bacteroidia bacterium]|jgi:translation initiation factor IF-2